MNAGTSHNRADVRDEGFRFGVLNGVNVLDRRGSIQVVDYGGWLAKLCDYIGKRSLPLLKGSQLFRNPSSLTSARLWEVPAFIRGW